MGIYAVEAVSGFTPGKLILRIRPGTAGGEKGAPDFYIIRFMIKGMPHVLLFMAWIIRLSGEAGFAVDLLEGFSALLTGVVFLGCLLAMGDRKQALHDRIARSAVYRIRDLE